MSQNDTWIQLNATLYFSALKLIDKFNESTIIEFKYLANLHHAFKVEETEQLNLLTDLIARIQQTNSHSLSTIVMTEQSTTSFWDLSSLLPTIKTSILIVFGTIAIFILIRLLLLCVKRRPDHIAHTDHRHSLPVFTDNGLQWEDGCAIQHIDTAL